jgi:uncharacterized protein YbbK (DUF523 family)
LGGSGEDILQGKAQVLNRRGEDITAQFLSGAFETLKIARMFGIKAAILKERSPSCGSKIIYDGSFTGNRRPGRGITAALLTRNGVTVFSEDEMDNPKLQTQRVKQR